MAAFRMGCAGSTQGPTKAELEAATTEVEREIAHKEAELEALKAKRAEEARRINEQIKASRSASKKPKVSKSSTRLAGYTDEQMEELRGQTASINKAAAAKERLRKETAEKEAADAAAMAAALSKLAQRGYRAHAKVGSWRWAYENVNAYLHEMNAEDKRHYFKQLEEQQKALRELASDGADGIATPAPAHHSIAHDVAHAFTHPGESLRRAIRKMALFTHLGTHHPKQQQQQSTQLHAPLPPPAASKATNADELVANALRYLTETPLPTVIESIHTLNSEQQAAFQRISRATAPSDPAIDVAGAHDNKQAGGTPRTTRAPEHADIGASHQSGRVPRVPIGGTAADQPASGDL